METKEFQAQVKQLLDLMIHSIYINKQIFLRELISNASDALDKLRYKALTDTNLLDDDSELSIRIDIDDNTKTLSIIDNGIGMTYDEVMDNIGTIAKSGTKQYLQELQNDKTSIDKSDLIGQFGVGFYSAFIVASKVTIITRAAGKQEGVRWESVGDGTYTIDSLPITKRGTTVILSIREEFFNSENPEGNYLNRYTIQNLVKKYSNFVRYPIKMDFYKEESATADVQSKEKTITVETKILNDMIPIWVKDKKEVAEADYFQFYKHTFHDWNEPFRYIHTKAEGITEFTALLYIPSKAPSDFYSKDSEARIQLFSKNVFIMDSCNDLLPDYLKFVRGLIDSPDLSLNISREILQHNRQLTIIGRNIEKKILSTLESIMTKEREKYEEFWEEFGKAIKGGIYMDYKNKEKLQDLLLFHSSSLSKGLTSLNEYVSRMPESQKDIYYVVVKDKAAVDYIPQLEIFKEKQIEVLYLFDKVDEFMLDTLREYHENKFKSVSRGELEMDISEDKTNKSGDDKYNGELLKIISEYLKDKVKDVKVSNRLKTTPVCLVSDDNGISLSMEKIFNEMDRTMFKANRILEINPNHILYQTLLRIYQKDSMSPVLKDYSELLYEQAMLMEGLQLENPVGFVNKIANLMSGVYAQ
jgi:molecular chaperone HtpG